MPEARLFPWLMALNPCYFRPRWCSISLVKHILRFGDIIAIALVIALLALSLVIVAKGAGSSLVSISFKDGESLYSLSEDRTVNVPGPLGFTVVQIKDGAASVLESPCPNHTCMLDGAISEPGAVIACLPNRVMVTITGQREVDVVSH